MTLPEDEDLVPLEFGPAELQALAVDEPYVEIDVQSGDALFAPLDGHTDLGDLIDDVLTRTQAARAGPMSSVDRAPTPGLSGSGATLTLRGLGEPFVIPANAESLAASLELAYSVGGWSMFDEVAESARTALAAFDEPLRDALAAALTYTAGSIAALAGNYLVQLERTAERMLGQVLDERALYLADVRRELLDADGETLSLQSEDDGAGGRRPVKRARMLLTDLECIRLLDEEVGITRQQQATAQALALALKAVKLKLDPFGGLLADFASAPRWVEDVAALIGLAEADVEAALEEFRDRAALAASVASSVRARLITREPLMAAVVLSFGEPVPTDPKEVAVAIDGAVNAAALATTHLRERLEREELSIRDRWDYDPNLVDDMAPARVVPLLEQEGFFDPRNRPEWVWAHILDGGPLQAAPGLPNTFTLWDLGPLITAADAALRQSMGEGRLEALAGACLREMRLRRLWESLKTAGADVAFGLLLGAGSVLAGPLRPVFVAAEVLASFCAFAATAERFQIETDVEQSDWAGSGNTLRRLSDHAPDTLSLVLEGVNAASSVLIFMPKLKLLRAVIDASVLATAAGQAGFMLLALAASEPADAEEDGDAVGARPNGAP